MPVEVIEGCESSISRALSKMYSSTLENYPDMEKIRFLPTPKYIQNSSTISILGEIMNRQGWYTQRTSTKISWEILELEIITKGLSKSLGETIIDMKTKKKQTLFIMLATHGIITLFTLYIQLYENESRNCIADLASFVSFTYGSRAFRKYFTRDAALRALESSWDEAQGCALH